MAGSCGGRCCLLLPHNRNLPAVRGCFCAYFISDDDVYTHTHTNTDVLNYLCIWVNVLVRGLISSLSVAPLSPLAIALVVHQRTVSRGRQRRFCHDDTVAPKFVLLRCVVLVCQLPPKVNTQCHRSALLPNPKKVKLFRNTNKYFPLCAHMLIYTEPCGWDRQTCLSHSDRRARRHVVFVLCCPLGAVKVEI